MNRRWFLGGLLAAIVVAGVSAEARMHAPYRGHRIVPASTAPLDGFTQPAAAYSFRKVRSAYAGPAVKLRRTTGGTSDIGFVGTDFDTAAAATFCNATTCFLDTWYDQSTNARHATQATTTLQPALIFNCSGSNPCARVVASEKLLTASFTPATGKGSLSVVAARRAGGICYLVSYGAANSMQTTAVANTWGVGDGVNTQTNAQAADGVFHTGIGVINGTGTLLAVDQVEATGVNVAGSAVAGQNVMLFGSGGTTCDAVEGIVWDNYFLTPTERTALAQNQKDYWMPLPLDTFATPAGAYSMRRLKSSYAGPAIRLRRASDNAELNIGFLGFTSFTGAPIDTAAANAFCAATSCFIKTIYDQSGNARDVTQATPANQPAYSANCQNGLPCAVSTATAQVLVGPSITPAGSQSFSLVAKSASPENCSFVKTASNFLSSNSGGTWWVLFSTAALIDDHATHGAWHSGQGVLQASGTGSTLTTDNFFDYTAAIGPNLAAGTIRVSEGGAAGTIPCSTAEAVWWNGYGLTQPERTALQTNQKNFWGTP